MNPRIIELNDSNFDAEVLRSARPVLVVFSAEWSRSSQGMAPHINSVAEDEAATLKVGKVDVNRSPTLATRHGVRAIPTLILFRHGAVLDRIVGSATTAEIREVLEPLGMV